jgi:anti-anti-sigma factor
VTFLDSTGIAALVAARNRAIDEKTALTLINCQPIIRQVLDVTGLLGPLTEE